MTPDSNTVKTCTLHVCTSCRPPGISREPKENRPGFILYQQLLEAFKFTRLKDRVEVLPAECLSICPRPCGISLSSSGSWTYLFGDQRPNLTVNGIKECVSLYLETQDGFMERKKRPGALRSSILGRIPPTKKRFSCT